VRNLETIILKTNETLFGRWLLSCSPMNQGIYEGNLYVTDKAIYFDAPFNKMLNHLIDVFSSPSSIENELSFTVNLLKYWREHNYLEIYKNDIKEILVRTSFLKKKMIVILKDENEIVFYTGLFFSRKIENSLNNKF
jgi:uncharacterized protein YdaL